MFSNNNFKMSNKKAILDQQQTNIHSPPKIYNNGFDKSAEQPWALFSNQKPKEQFTSVTQTHLYSRSIVRKLMQSAKQKTIRHEINQIDRSSVLYAKPGRYDRSQVDLNAQSKNKNYSSMCASKIKQINERLSQKGQNIKKNKSQIHTSATETAQQQKVSVSGLVTYKFSSVNAQRSLGFNEINHEQKMKQDMKQAKKAQACTKNRFKKILYNTNHKRYKESIRQERNILSDFTKKTDEYLKDRVKEKEEQNLVYGEKAKNLHFIKQYMHTEKAEYDIGRHIVDQIEKNQPKQEYIKHRACKTEVDEDLQFERRKIPFQRKRVNIRFLTFVD